MSDSREFDSVGFRAILRGSRRETRTAPAWLAVAAFTASFGVRLLHLGAKSLGRDEGVTWAYAIESVRIILAGQDIHPPGYYLLVHFVTYLSEHEFLLRLPSALGSAAASALVLAIGWRLFGATAGLLAGFLSVVSPLDLWYAQEARQPAIAAFAVVLGAYGLVRKDGAGILIASIALAFGLMIDFVTVAGWAAVGGVWTFMCWGSDRRQVWTWALITAPIFGAFEFFLGDRFAKGALFLRDTTQDWYAGIFGSALLRSTFGIFLLIYVISIVSAWIYRWIYQRLERSTFWILVFGFVLAMIALSVPRAYSLKKILIVGWPIPILLISQQVVTYRTAARRAWAAGTLLVASIAASVVVLFVHPRADWRSVTAHISSQSHPGEVVWVSEVPWEADAYLYYGGDLKVFREDDPETQLRQPLPDGVWLVASRTPRDSIPSISAEAWFDDNWILIEEWAYDYLALKHYAPPPGG